MMMRKYFILSAFMAMAALCGSQAFATETDAAQRDLLQLKNAVDALSTDMSNKLSAVKACNEQGMYWSPTGCQPTDYMNISTQLQDVSVVVDKCNDGCRGNGSKGTTCNVYDIYNCPAGMTPDKTLIDVVGEGADKSIVIRSCRNYKNFTGHNKDRYNGDCALKGY